jgi:phosphonate transport system substrate-binding protein
MNHKTSVFVALVFIAFNCFIFSGLNYSPFIISPAQAKDKSPPQTVYRFGVVPQFEHRKLYRIWIPILQKLEADTGLRFELIGSRQIPSFEQDFLSGMFDFAYMNPYHIVAANNQQGYLPLVRDGSRKLQGIVVVRKDSPIQSIRELRGQLIAFPSANALGASLLPRSELHRLHKIQVKPKYVKTHTSVYLHVVQRLAKAGGGVESTLQRQKPEIRDSLRILYRTRGVNPHPIVAHPRVPAAHFKLVQEALIAMGKREKDRELLAKIPMRTVVEANLNHYSEVRKMKIEEYIERPGPGSD